MPGRTALNRVEATLCKVGCEEGLDALRVRRALVPWSGSLGTVLRFARCLPAQPAAPVSRPFTGICTDPSGRAIFCGGVA